MPAAPLDHVPRKPLSLSPEELEELSAEELLAWASAEFGEKLCLTCSWQKQSSVLVHMVAALDRTPAVIELDTHLFFRESYDTRDRLVERYGLELLRPHVPSIAEQHRHEGPNLWERDPDRCCHVRKVEPLLSALEPYDASAARDGDLRRLLRLLVRQQLRVHHHLMSSQRL